MKLVFKENFLTKAKNSYSLHIGLGVLSLCFLFSALYWNSPFGISDYLAANPSNIFADKEYWRLFTTIFVHGDLKHLLSNSIMLVLMGNFVHAFFGKYQFPIIPILMGAVVNIFVLLTFDRDINIVGISGVVYYLWGFWLYLYLKIQTHESIFRRILKVTAIGGFLLIPEVFEANVSHLAHFLGLCLGIFTAAIYWGFNHTRIKAYEKFEPEYEKEYIYEYFADEN